MGLLFKNNAETTLSSGINNSTTTVPVASAAVFPTPNANNVFFATIDDGSNVEVVKVTGISSNDLTVVRAQDNTSAAAFGTGAKIELRLTAKVLETGTTSLTDLDGDTAIFLEQLDDEDNIRIDTSGLQRVLIDSTGDVAVGSRGTNPMGLGISGTVLAVTEQNNVASVQIDGNTGTRIDMGTQGSRNAVFYTDANQLEISRTTDHPIKFVINSGEVARFTSGALQLAASKNISNASGDLTLDVAGNIILDADGANIDFYDGGTHFAYLQNENNDLRLGPIIQDADFIVRGNDGGTYIDGLTIDFSDAGRALFNGSIDIGGTNITRTGDLTIDVSGDITLDAGGENIKLHDDGIEVGQIDLGSSNVTIRSSVQDKNTIFRGNDGGTEIEAMRIDYAEGGRVGINESSPDNLLHVNSGSTNVAAKFESTDSIAAIQFTDSGGSAEIGCSGTSNTFYPNGVLKMSLDSSGNLVVSGNVTAYGSPSDIRLKENVEVIDNALDKVKQLKGITYDLKSDGNRLTGLIAQDLEKVLPEAVYTEKDLETEEEHLAIRYGNTVGLLVEAIKEQQKQIETLTAKVKELEVKE